MERIFIRSIGWYEFRLWRRIQAVWIYAVFLQADINFACGEEYQKRTGELLDENLWVKDRSSLSTPKAGNEEVDVNKNMPGINRHSGLSLRRLKRGHSVILVVNSEVKKGSFRNSCSQFGKQLTLSFWFSQ